MKLSECKPASFDLQYYIERYSLLEFYREALSAHWERCIPDGFIKIFFYEKPLKGIYKNEKGTILSWNEGVGGHPVDQNSFIKLPSCDWKFFWVSFKPAQFYQLFKIPITEINNGICPLECFLGKDGLELKEKIFEAPDFTSVVQQFDTFFSKLIAKKNLKPSSMITIQNSIFSSNGNMEVGKIAQTERISIRTLQRKFQEEIGVSPKHFARIIRFNHILRLIRKDSNNPDWQGIIDECGYFDHSHFIHDVKSVTGDKPSDYFNKICRITDMHAGR